MGGFPRTRRAASRRHRLLIPGATRVGSGSDDSEGDAGDDDGSSGGSDGGGGSDSEGDDDGGVAGGAAATPDIANLKHELAGMRVAEQPDRVLVV